MDRFSANIDDFGIDAFCFQFDTDFLQQPVGVAILSRASVECDDFHGSS